MEVAAQAEAALLGLNLEKAFLREVAERRSGAFPQWAGLYLDALSRRYLSFDTFGDRPMSETERTEIREYATRLAADRQRGA